MYISYLPTFEVFVIPAPFLNTCFIIIEITRITVWLWTPFLSNVTHFLGLSSSKSYTNDLEKNGWKKTATSYSTSLSRDQSSTRSSKASTWFWCYCFSKLNCSQDNSSRNSELSFNGRHSRKNSLHGETRIYIKWRKCQTGHGKTRKKIF